MRKLVNLIILASLVLSFPIILSAQQRECDAMSYLESQKRLYPEIEKRMQATERFTQLAIKKPSLRSEQTIVIPVVVHVLYHRTSEKISYETVQSQIDVLNEDFQRINANQDNYWPQAANPNIAFELAKVAPDGSATDGVNYRFSSKPYYQANNEMKYSKHTGIDAWPSDQYLNIWVCNLFGNKMGYAQFPNGGAPETDGVVVDYAFFGRTNTSARYGLGRTCTHEVGHWLNLRHIWGDKGGCSADDHVSDTPNAGSPSYSCNVGRITCGSVDMIQNFMDYSPDNCMNLFTRGQKARMRALFEPGGFRESLLHSHALGHNNPPEEDDDDNECPNSQNCDEESPPVEEDPEENLSCDAPFNLDAYISNKNLYASWEGNAKKYIFEIQLPGSSSWFSFSWNSTKIQVSNIKAGPDYKVRVKGVCEDGSHTAYSYFGTIGPKGSGNRLLQVSTFQTYPNPAVDKVWIEWNAEAFASSNHANLKLTDVGLERDYTTKYETVQVADIELINILGQKILNQVVEKDAYTQQLNVSNLESGLYIVVLRDQKGQIISSQMLKIK